MQNHFLLFLKILLIPEKISLAVYESVRVKINSCSLSVGTRDFKRKNYSAKGENKTQTNRVFPNESNEKSINISDILTIKIKKKNIFHSLFEHFTNYSQGNCIFPSVSFFCLLQKLNPKRI